MKDFRKILLCAAFVTALPAFAGVSGAFQKAYAGKCGDESKAVTVMLDIMKDQATGGSGCSDAVKAALGKCSCDEVVKMYKDARASQGSVVGQ